MINPRWLATLTLVLSSCGTGPEDEPLGAEFAVAYDPGVIVLATETCDRLVDHVLLVLGDEGTFELSINIVDDCTRGGGGFEFSEVLRFGTYTRDGSAIAFTTDPPESASIAGALEPNAIVLSFPESVGPLGPTAATLRVPRSSNNPGFPS